MSFPKQFLTALYRFGSYPELFKVKGIKTFFYTVITVVVATLLMTVAAIPGYIKLGGIEGLAKKYIPDFTISNGKLKMDKKDYTDAAAGTRIYIDTSVKSADKTKADGAAYAIIAGCEDMYVYNGVQGSTLKFSEIGDLSSDDIQKSLAKKDVKASIISAVVFMYLIAQLFKALYDILLLTLIGNLINSFTSKLNIGFGQMMKLSAYARTLPFLLSLILPILTGIPFNGIVFYAVGGFYIYKGLKNTKLQSGIIIADISDLNNGVQDNHNPQ